jgi:uncharacterized protein (DUF1778 family)
MPCHPTLALVLGTSCGYIVGTMTAKTKDWKLRVGEDEDRLVRAASDSTDSQFSSFVRAAAVSEAHRVLADRGSFALNADAWKKFCDLLDRPAQVPSGLEDLFSKPSVFE